MQLKKELTRLDAQEDNLLDHLADATLPGEKIRARLTDITKRRQKIRARLTDTKTDLTAGADILRRSLALTTDPVETYRRSPAAVRRTLNPVYWTALYLDELGQVADDQRTDAFEDLRVAQNSWTADRNKSQEGSKRPSARTRTEGRITLNDLLATHEVQGSSKPVMVGLIGRYSNRLDLREQLDRLDAAMRERAGQRPASTPTAVGPGPWKLAQRLGPDGVAEVVRLYQDGMSALEVAEAVGIAKSTVLRVLRDAGVEVRPWGVKYR